MYSNDTPDSKEKITDFAAGLVSAKELHREVELPVHGRLPWYLNGTLYRVGPGIFDVYHSDGLRADMDHWFDGIGVVFKFTMNAISNKMTYMCRNINPEAIRAIESTPKAHYKGLGFSATGPAAPTFLNRIRKIARPLTRDPQTGAVPININVALETIPGQGALIARSDLSTALRLDPATLEPKGRFEFTDIHPGLAGQLAAAHSTVDARTGELFNVVGGDMKRHAQYTVFSIGRDGDANVLATIQHTSHMCYMHSISITERYVVVAIAPWRLNVRDFIVKGGCAFAPSLRFDAECSTVFYVISREERRVVAAYDADAICALHYINAFDAPDGDAVLLDVCEYDSANVIEDYYLDNLRTKQASWFTPVTPRRYTLSGLHQVGAHILRSTATWRPLSEHRLEMPCVAPDVVGRPYRYLYGVSHDDLDQIISTTIKKIDLKTGEVRLWRAPRCVVGEPVFVSEPGGVDEDHGVVMFVVVDAAKAMSFLVVLDAKSMLEICRADTPQTVPHTFHGVFMEGLS